MLVHLSAAEERPSFPSTHYSHEVARKLLYPIPTVCAYLKRVRLNYFPTRVSYTRRVLVPDSPSPVAESAGATTRATCGREGGN